MIEMAQFEQVMGECHYRGYFALDGRRAAKKPCDISNGGVVIPPSGRTG